MPYIYHVRPEKMIGNVLYPLNKLKELNAPAYENEKKKYKGREEIMKDIIPKLDCLWNDVIHFSPVHPNLIYKALTDAGLKYANLDWFKIDISKIANIPFVIYGNRYETQELLPEDFDKVLIKDYRELEEVPKEAISWYKDAAKNNYKPLLFRRIPHVLVKGGVDITDSEIIWWQDNKI